MYFKRIEMTGFKSFVDHTVVSFGSGITAIIGPNGCGKSNISDAIRWVLGEQRAKMLRGSRMDDFIFSGSSTRKQAGMAEVSITIADIAGQISKPELAEYSEVTVTRRLYRSGESEYLINKMPCRLKDVIELFLDSGISTDAFSIIEQGQIQRIVTSKPENRRFIIEEAAGIMKYKSRKHAAINKLNGAETNLERVGDIIGELERQRNMLKRQANKAERYKVFKDEMDSLFLSTSHDELHRLREVDATASEKLSELEHKRVSLETEIATLKNNLISMQSGMDEAAEQLSSMKEEEYRITSSTESGEDRIVMFGQQINEAEQTAERLSAEVSETKIRLDNLAKELSSKEDSMEKLSEEVRGKTSQLEEKKEAFSLSRADVEEVHKQIASLEASVAEQSSILTRKGNDLASDKTRVEMLIGRKERIENEKNEAEKSLGDVATRKTEKGAAVKELTGSFDAIQQQLKQLSSNIGKLAAEKEQQQQSISEKREQITEQSAKLTSLTELEKSHEGYQDGIRSLLEMKESGDSIGETLHGTLVEQIKVEKRFEKALELLLGNRLQAVVVSSASHAKSAIETLHAGNLGRATFLAIEQCKQQQPSTLPSHSGIIGRASDVVEADAELKPLIEKLLKDVVLVENIDTAIELHKESPFTFITPRGDMLDGSGVISGGSFSGSGGLLERKRMMEELSIMLGKNRTALEAEIAKQEQTVAELNSLTIESDNKSIKLKELERSLIHEQKDLETVEMEHGRQSERLNTFIAEIGGLDADREKLQADISQLTAESSVAEQARSEAAEELERLSRKARDSSGSIDLLGETISAMQVALTSLNGELNMAMADKQRIEQNLEELTERSSRMEADIAASSDKKQRLSAEIENIKENIHNGLERKQEITSKIALLSDELSGQRASLTEKEGSIKTSEDALAAARDELSDVKLKKSEAEMKMEQLLERLDEHNLSIHDIEQHEPEEIDMAEARERMAELRVEMARIGDVNLGAIDDYNQVMERLTFLTTQRDDLMSSIADIQRVIDKLNRTTKKLFEDAFYSIRENFRTNFKRLFNGGEADMILTDESNLLESGIDIIARPPGKKRQNITLLSMGEKSMTAVAILFSVFMVKPSPFCLLDEVDAPLDEANVQRFKDILSDFAATTQFLVITHNQKTMAFADRLYGITMQQPGISQVLSVDMVETDAVSLEQFQREPASAI